MRNKIAFYIMCFVGIVSIFLPYYESLIIACGLGPCYKDYQYINFFKMYCNSIQFSKHEFLNFIDILIQTLIAVSILFSAVLYFFKRYLIIIILSVISVMYFLLSLVYAFDVLRYGFYILLFQQIALFLLLIKRLKQ